MDAVRVQKGFSGVEKAHERRINKLMRIEHELVSEQLNNVYDTCIRDVCVYI